MQKYVDEGRLGGVVTLVARGGKVAYLQAFGTLDPSDGGPDADRRRLPHRLADQGRDQRRGHDPVRGRQAPARRPRLQVHPRVQVDDRRRPRRADKGKKGPGYTIVPAKRQITVRDLLTHTSGISYGDGPAKDLYKQAGIRGWFLADRAEPVGEVIKRLAKLPFDAQPGEKYIYGYNTDILGYLVEVVSGMSLADFVRKRITEPLAMADTSFFLPEEKTGRLSAVYGDRQGRQGRPSSTTPRTSPTSRARGRATPAGPVCSPRPRTTPASCSCSRAGESGAASTSSARNRSSS